MPEPIRLIKTDTLNILDQSIADAIVIAKKHKLSYKDPSMLNLILQWGLNFEHIILQGTKLLNKRQGCSSECQCDSSDEDQDIELEND